MSSSNSKALRWLVALGLGLLPAAACAADTTVTTAGLAFSPADVTITAGETVTWTNLSSHNVAEVDGPTDTTYNGGFYSGAVGSVTTWQHTFNTPGTYYYICEPHVFSGMRGSVTVLPPPAPISGPWSTLAVSVAMMAAGTWLILRRFTRLEALVEDASVPRT